jgi:hypothetical protein
MLLGHLKAIEEWYRHETGTCLNWSQLEHVAFCIREDNEWHEVIGDEEFHVYVMANDSSEYKHYAYELVIYREGEPMQSEYVKH